MYYNEDTGTFHTIITLRQKCERSVKHAYTNLR